MICVDYIMNMEAYLIVFYCKIFYSAFAFVTSFKYCVSCSEEDIMEETGYNITEKEFKKISKWAENVYNIAVIVDYFVSNQPEIE